MSVLAAVDLNWLLQFIVTVFLVAFGLLHLVKNTASKYFLAEDHDNDDVSDWSTTPATTTTSTATARKDSTSGNHMTTTAGMRGDVVVEDTCVVCGNRTNKKCSRCKMVMYCSEHCQRSHWRSEHKLKCKDFQLFGKSVMGGSRASSAVSLVSPGGSSNIILSKKILFPYEEFVEHFNWGKPGFPPCGLLNCGNSCFANVVLQCLSYTRPLIAFLLEKGHRRECGRNDWCFLCEFQTHVERASRTLYPFSPINILSRLPNIGGNLGYGKQEDAHEFMRFAIDTMQSVCLDEFGGEKAVHHTSQETTLIQHIFGGHLQSQVICAKCNNVSNQLENMMDLTVEIQGDAVSLEECLDQFTAKEWLHGDNMYRCDGCNDYVMAWKQLSIRRAPNILTIALKRFQSGRFGKLNKRVTFPETLDLSTYMSETGEEDNFYKLYAVIVHVDMLNASFFGHYICYIKDFCGKWYRIDDCKVMSVDIDEVLSQGAYMLLYSRICARSSCLYHIEPPVEEENVEVKKEVDPSSEHPVQCPSAGEPTSIILDSVIFPSDSSIAVDAKEDVEMLDFKETSPVSMDKELLELPGPIAAEEVAANFEYSASNTRFSTEVVIVEMKPSSLPSNDKYETEGSKCISQEYSLRHLSGLDYVPTQNYVNEEKEMKLSSENPVQFFSTRESTDTFVDPVILPSDNTSKSEVACCEIGLSSICHSKDVKEDLELDLEKNITVSMDGELNELPGSIAAEEEAAPRGHAYGLVLGNNASNTIYSTEVDAVKVKQSSPLSNGEYGTGGSKSIPQEYCSRHSLDQDSVANQNHVCKREEIPLNVSAAVSISIEISGLSKVANSRNKTGTAGCGLPSSDNLRDAARKADVKRSGAKAKPLFPPGFLEKRPQKKYIKNEDNASGELVEPMSYSNINCQKNGVTRPDLCCKSGDAMTHGERKHFDCHDNGCSNFFHKNVGMLDEDTQMCSSEFNEPSNLGNGGSRKPIILE